MKSKHIETVMAFLIYAFAIIYSIFMKDWKVLVFWIFITIVCALLTYVSLKKRIKLHYKIWSSSQFMLAIILGCLYVTLKEDFDFFMIGIQMIIVGTLTILFNKIYLKGIKDGKVKE